MSVTLVTLVKFCITDLHSAIEERTDVVHSVRHRLRGLLTSSPISKTSFEGQSSSRIRVKSMTSRTLRILSTRRRLFIGAALCVGRRTPFVGSSLHVSSLTGTLYAGHAALTGYVGGCASKSLALLRCVGRFHVSCTIRLLTSPGGGRAVSRVTRTTNCHSHDMFGHRFTLVCRYSPSIFQRGSLYRTRKRVPSSLRGALRG